MVVLSACGADSVAENDGSEQADIKMISGGTPSSQVALDLASRHEVSSDAFNNYYQVSVQKGDKLVVYVVLDQLLDGTSMYRCKNNNHNTFQNNYYPGIRIDGGCIVN